MDAVRTMTDDVTNAIFPHLEALGALAPLILKHRATFDRERRLPDPVFEALAECVAVVS